MIDRYEFLKKVPADEPVFILRAQDKFMPRILREWATSVEIGTIQSHERVGVITPKVREARDLATQVEEWQKINGCKVPD